MTERIPTYELPAFAGPGQANAEVFFPDYATAKPRIPLQQPYRGDYYKISLCLRGRAELKVNLAPYAVTAGCLVLATPDVIKEWVSVSEDYETLSIFFTKDFITTNNGSTGRLSFLVQPTTYVFQLTAPEADNVALSFRFLQQKYNTPHAHRSNILKNILNGLLYEVGAIHDRSLAGGPPAAKSRGQALVVAFKELVQMHSSRERSVRFYADTLCVTPKHLSELVKEATGKTAGEWIAAAVVLEAKALLEDQARTVYQVAECLHFTDQFAFSRFFKKTSGLSPSAYRQAG
ncbi:helix-turn-helix domain-containing protein [Hymenobacter cellulosilyticus]|uniref:Helix-turn-helix transcriptional regulator n=1 Tax=Hymenobacter cellulosilyticus TaxID=2932248 RepID=A0A8T9PZT4_9BACT|nr:helix-turn-helix transcriptional regulator [Hymenobacter cellulosilyticus]UOQ71006.1 helix-turn-helix transcriptional regulator [Hymenobacter cellulosilyticus]